MQQLCRNAGDTSRFPGRGPNPEPRDAERSDGHAGHLIRCAHGCSASTGRPAAPCITRTTSLGERRALNAATEKRSAFCTARAGSKSSCRCSHRPREGLDVVERHQPSRLPVEHRLERSAGCGRDHRASCRLRLDRDDAELLHARHDHRARARVQLGELLVVGAPEELGLGVGGLECARGSGSGADHADRRARPPGRLERDVQALVARPARRRRSSASPGVARRKRSVSTGGWITAASRP